MQSSTVLYGKKDNVYDEIQCTLDCFGLKTTMLSLCYKYTMLNLFLESVSRKEKTTLNRLLIGHSHLTHSYLINKDPAPTCEHCKCIRTIEHILCTCTTYEHNRNTILLPPSTFTHIIAFSET